MTGIDGYRQVFYGLGVHKMYAQQTQITWLITPQADAL